MEDKKHDWKKMAKEEVEEGTPSPAHPPEETFDAGQGWEDTEELDKDEPGKFSDDMKKAHDPVRNKEKGGKDHR